MANSSQSAQSVKVLGYGVQLFVMALLFVGSLWIRLSLISKGPYSVDTLNLAIKAEQLVTTLQLSYSYGSGYPLTIFCGGFFVALAKITGIHDSVIAVNFMSVFMGAACVPLLYGLVDKLIDRTTGLFAALFLSVSPIFLAVSTYGLSHAPALFFLLLGIYLLLAYRDSRQTWLFVGSAMAVGFLGAARMQNLILMAPLVGFLLWSISSGRRIKVFMNYALIALFSMGIFYLPYFLGEYRDAYLAQIVRYKDDSVIQHASIGLLFKPFLNIVYHIIHSFTPLGFVLMAIGTWLLGKSDNRNGYFAVLIWLVVPVILYSRLYTLVPRFLTIIHPPLCIVMAYFCSYYFREGRVMRFLSVTLVATMLFGMVGIVYPVLKNRHHQAVIPEYVRWVVKNVPDNARIVTVDDSLFFIYYSNLELLSRFHAQYRTDLTAHTQFQRELNELLRKDIPVYITEHGLYNYDPHGEFSGMVQGAYRLESVGVRTYEFWQESCWQSGRYPRQLYRILPKAG